MFSKHTKKRGFTLIELLIATFIFVILAGLVISNFNRGAKNDELRRTAAEISGVLRKAQSLALIGSQQNLPAGAITTGKFGVHFDKISNTYQLFLDWQEDGGDGLFQNEEKLPGASYNLPQGVIINNLRPTGDFLDITFCTPKPTIYFNGAAGELEAIVELKQASASSFQYVKINRVSGQISVENSP